MSRSLKLIVLGCGLCSGLLALGACDRQGGAGAQGEPSAAAAAAGGSQQDAKGLDRTHKGAALPELTFADPSGNKLALASLVGRPTLINLWATWCAPCVKELPTLEALAAGGRVRVVTVSQDSAEPAKIAAFLKDKGLTRLPPWLDPDNSLAFHYNGGTLPMTVLYGANGQEVWRFTGERDWSSPGSAALIAEAR